MSLGRGLGALITATASRKKTVFNTGDSSGRDGERVWQVPVGEIHPNANQPRRQFNADDLNELAQSIKQHGVLQPLLVAEKPDGGYELVAGERRWRAAQLSGLPSVPVMVKKLADQQKLEVALIENIQRQDLNPIEEAFAYRRLLDEFGLTQQAVAEKVGKSRPAIANAVRLLELPDEVQTALIQGKINTGQARALLSIAEKDEQLKILSSMLGERITVRELEREAAKRSKTPRRRDPNLLYLEDNLRQFLGAKVAISSKGERGTITINYHSLEELNELVKKITE